MNKIRLSILLVLLLVFGVSCVHSTSMDLTTLSHTSTTLESTTTTQSPSTSGSHNSSVPTTTTTTIIVTSTSQSQTSLATPINLRVEGHYLIWDEVESCERYLVRINGVDFYVSTHQYPLNLLESGMHNIKVRALGDNISFLNSPFSAVYNYENIPYSEMKKLGDPEIVSIMNNRIAWNAVAGAVSYVIRVNEGAYQTVLSTFYDITTTIPGVYLVEIYAKGDNTTFSDSNITRFSYEIFADILIDISGIQIQNQLLVWDSIPHALQYEVRINEEVFRSSERVFSLNHLLPGDYTISIRAIGDDLFYLPSMWSSPIHYVVPKEPVFITTKLDQLFLGDEPIRFVSFNVPNLLVVEDPFWHRIDPWEQEDAIKSVALMGGLVIRTYTFSIIGGIRPLESNNQLAHIMGIGQYNEDLFRDLDRAIELAGRYGVYLIIPFIDEWNWWGGVAEFSAMFGKTKAQFYTDPTVKLAFKEFLFYLLNRVNTLTGIKYKDDPAILAWELGNELRSASDAWIGEMAAYVKSIDSNHLLMSGRDKVTTYDLNHPQIDIITSHYYTNNGTGSFASRAKADRLLTLGKKPFIIGEYGLVDFAQIEAMVLESVNNGTSGSLIWSLRFRNVNGGFYYHSDGPSRSYHYPGFPINDDYQETRIINLLIESAHLVRNLGPYVMELPDPPTLFDTTNGSLTWRGSTGSSSFIVERMSETDANWMVIGVSIYDSYPSGPFYTDHSGLNGVLYYYRVKAVNAAGESSYSNIISYRFP